MMSQRPVYFQKMLQFQPNIICLTHQQQYMNIKQLDSDRSESDEDHQPKKQVIAKKQIKKTKSPIQPVPNKLVYPPTEENVKNQKEETKVVKAQTKTQIKAIKSEQKNQKAKKKGLFYNELKQKKKETQKLAFPPPQKQIPLKATKPIGEEKQGKNVWEQTNKEVKLLIHKMKLIYKKDLDCFMKGELAYYKVRYLKTLSEKLNNLYFKRQFIEEKGLKQFQKWLERIINEQKVEFQPSLALKIGLIRILREMNLTSEQLESTKHLKYHISRNRYSQIQELRELATDLISQWQYVAINTNAQQPNK